MDARRGERYHEEINLFGTFIMIILCAAGVYCILSFVKNPTIQYGVLFLVTMIFSVCFGPMVITVDEEKLTVRSKFLHWLRKDILLADIQSAEVITYRPIREFGGWGIRCGKFRGERTGCISMKGSRGVLLTLVKNIRILFIMPTTKIIVGSQRPEELKQSIRRI